MFREFERESTSSIKPSPIAPRLLLRVRSSSSPSREALPKTPVEVSVPSPLQPASSLQPEHEPVLNFRESCLAPLEETGRTPLTYRQMPSCLAPMGGTFSTRPHKSLHMYIRTSCWSFAATHPSIPWPELDNPRISDYPTNTIRYSFPDFFFSYRRFTSPSWCLCYVIHYSALAFVTPLL
jgi:hypothetical protein